jgi:hypothetical protein
VLVCGHEILHLLFEISHFETSGRDTDEITLNIEFAGHRFTAINTAYVSNCIFALENKDHSYPVRPRCLESHTIRCLNR